ncbi:MAG: hypothetical protein QXK89_06075 [Candidatus Bathyarchaeia archaeon]
MVRITLLLHPPCKVKEKRGAENRLPINVNFLASEVGKPWNEIESLTYAIIKKLGLTIEATTGGEKIIEKKTRGRLLRAY